MGIRLGNVLRIIAVSEPLATSPVITLVPTTIAHVRELKESMRSADRREIEGTGFSSSQGLWRSYKSGLMNTTGLIDGKVAAIWGVGGAYMGTLGQPWLLTSEEVKRISPLQFARIYQKEVHKMLKLFPRLVNYVAADYEEAIRLLSIVGFDLHPPEKIGRAFYHKFEMVRS